MNQLELEMYKLTDELNQAWVQEIEIARKEKKYPNVNKVFSKYSEIMIKMKEAVAIAKVRLNLEQKPKKSLFGGKL